MIHHKVARRYAQALIMIATEKDNLEQMEKELAWVEEMLSVNSRLREVLKDPGAMPEEKKQALKQGIQDKVSSTIINFLFLLVDKKREEILPDILKEFRTYADQIRNIVDAEVRSAVQLTDKDFRELERRLCMATGKKIRLTSVIDTSLIGGLVVRIGDIIIDGSVVKRLALLQKHLQRSQFQGTGVIK